MDVYFQKETFIKREKWGLAFQRTFSSTFLQRCPACAKAGIFKNFFELKDTCPNCSVVLERDKGSAILSGALSYFLSIIITLLIAWPLIHSFGLFEGITFVFVGIITVLIFALHRPTKGLYLWMLWCFGFIYPDTKTANQLQTD